MENFLPQPLKCVAPVNHENLYLIPGVYLVSNNNDGGQNKTFTKPNKETDIWRKKQIDR